MNVLIIALSSDYVPFAHTHTHTFLVSRHNRSGFSVYPVSPPHSRKAEYVWYKGCAKGRTDRDPTRALRAHTDTHLGRAGQQSRASVWGKRQTVRMWIGACLSSSRSNAAHGRSVVFLVVVVVVVVVVLLVVVLVLRLLPPKSWSSSSTSSSSSSVSLAI